MGHGACVIHLADEEFDKVLLFALCVAVEGANAKAPV
jgi:hypothetical protein